MERIAAIVFILWLTACASVDPIPREPMSEKGSANAVDLVQLRGRLGMDHSIQDLGFFEKAFDGCGAGVRDENGKCGPRYFSIVNFRLRCRDSEETVSEVSAALTPVTTNRVQWKLAGQMGLTRTDRDGYGQVQVVTSGSLKGQRFVLIVGNQFLGKDIIDVTEIIVPNYWCKQLPSVLSKNNDR